MRADLWYCVPGAVSVSAIHQSALSRRLLLGQHRGHANVTLRGRCTAEGEPTCPCQDFLSAPVSSCLFLGTLFPVFTTFGVHLVFFIVHGRSLHVVAQSPGDISNHARVILALTLTVLQIVKRKLNKSLHKSKNTSQVNCVDLHEVSSTVCS